MIGRISLLSMALLPLEVTADENPLLALGRANLERTHALMACVNTARPGLPSDGILAFEIESHAPRSVSIKGAVVRVESFRAWSILLEFTEDKVFAFDNKTLGAPTAQESQDQFALPDFETTVPADLHTALGACGAEWMGDWDLPIEPLGAFAGSVGFDLTPPPASPD